LDWGSVNVADGFAKVPTNQLRIAFPIPTDEEAGKRSVFVRQDGRTFRLGRANLASRGCHSGISASIAPYRPPPIQSFKTRQANLREKGILAESVPIACRFINAAM